MPISESLITLFEGIAKAADICMKPSMHSVVFQNTSNELNPNEQIDELFLRIESRNPKGIRNKENDIELEIYKSGKEINLMMMWVERNDDLILWQGSHSMWMNENTGQKVEPSTEAEVLECLARRIRGLFEDSLLD